jgi:hypothetical protein
VSAREGFPAEVLGQGRLGLGEETKHLADDFYFVGAMLVWETFEQAGCAPEKIVKFWPIPSPPLREMVLKAAQLLGSTLEQLRHR